MSQIDDLHDAEDQCQAGRHQKQGDAQLQAVEELFDYQEHSFKRLAISDQHSAFSLQLQKSQGLAFQALTG
jgi:hypothetical protein